MLYALDLKFALFEKWNLTFCLTSQLKHMISKFSGSALDSLFYVTLKVKLSLCSKPENWTRPNGQGHKFMAGFTQGGEWLLQNGDIFFL